MRLHELGINLPLIPQAVSYLIQVVLARYRLSVATKRITILLVETKSMQRFRLLLWE